MTGLAFATTAAVHEDLGACFVGGAFFGARIDHARVTWQPDVLYCFYLPGGGPWSEGDRPRMVACRVRDDVCVATSSLNGRMVIPGKQVDLREWGALWAEPLHALRFSDPDYIVFIPLKPGMVAIARRGGQNVRVVDGRIEITETALSSLNTVTASGMFDIAYL